MYDQEQINFMLSMLSNTGTGLNGSANQIEAAMLAKLNKSLSGLKSVMGDWSVAWGPAVYQAPGSNVADNLMYIAKQEASGGEPAKLVLAIAGTNGASVFSIFVLDLWVSKQMPWNLLKPSEGKLSMGSYIGFQTLSNLKPGPNAVSPGVGLKAFMKSQTGSAVEVTVTGHSLGGALSPPLALWLHEQKNSWDPSNHATLSVMPSAGPTSGNGAWAKYYNQCLGSVTNRIWNSKDIVPHAWSLLDGLQNIYAPDIPSSEWIDKLVTGAQHLAEGGDYTQIETDKEFTGHINKLIIIPAVGDFVNYLTQALYQHTVGYLGLLKVQETPELKECCEGFKSQPDQLQALLEHKEPAMQLAIKQQG